MKAFWSVGLGTVVLASLLRAPAARACTLTPPSDPAETFSAAGGSHQFTARVQSASGASTCQPPSAAIVENPDGFISGLQVQPSPPSGILVTYTVAAQPPGGEQRVGVIAITFGSNPQQRMDHAVTQRESDAAPCDYSVTGPSSLFPSAGGRNSVHVSTAAGCSWYMTSSQPFVRIVSGGGSASRRRQGSGDVEFEVEPWCGLTSRDALLAVQADGPGDEYQARQAAAAFSITPSASYPGGAAEGSLTVQAPPGCAWTLENDRPDFVALSQAQGSGTAGVGYLVAANPTSTPRSATVRLVTGAGDDHVITQAAGSLCQFGVDPPQLQFDRAGGSQALAISVAGGSCAWSAAVSESWLQASPAAGSASATTQVQAAPFDRFGSRSAQVTVAGQTAAVLQTGCPLPPLLPGQPVAGEIALDDCPAPLRGPGYTADRYTFTAAAGQAIALELDGDFDTYLYLLDPGGNDDNLIATNDDSGGSLDSRIPPVPFLGEPVSFLPLAQSGTYTVEVTSFGPGATGPYTLALRTGTSIDSDGDGSPDGVELLQGTDPFTRDNDVVADERLFVLQVYRDLLRREAESGGIAYWVGQLESGSRTRADMVAAFLFADEFEDVVASVTRLYFAYFLRIPDTAGLLFWIDQNRLGVPLANISEFFAQSREFQDRYGSLSNAEFVTLVYENVLGREPDPGGLAFWTGELDGGRRGRGQVMLEFSESAEHVARLRNAVNVTLTYVGLLGRAPDPSGFDYWVGQLDSGLPVLEMIRGFLSTDEYFERFLPITDSDGDRLADRVETNDGVFVSPFRTGTDPFNPDTDLDAIGDGDEALGAVDPFDGALVLDLPAMGASPLRQDVFVEYDWLDDAQGCGAHTHRPSAAAIAAVAAALAGAPNQNPDSSTGISLHQDYGQGGAFTGGNAIPHGDGRLEGGLADAEFRAHKAAHFDLARLGYFHYAILGHAYDGSSPNSGQAEYYENDFLVTLGCSLGAQDAAAAILHGLGHNLGLLHGGGSECNWNPSYNSVMNSRYEFAGVDVDCDARGDGVLDFSRGTRVPLDEAALDESAGVCGTIAVDWNGDSAITAAAYELNRRGASPLDPVDDAHCACGLAPLSDHDDWGRLFLNSIFFEDSFHVVDCDPRVD